MNVKLEPIEHPAHNAWDTRVPAVLNEEQINALTARFKDSPVAVHEIGTEIEYQTLRSETHRHTHEHAQVALLGLSKLDRVYYRRLAGKEHLVGEFIRFFGEKATAALTAPVSVHTPKKIALDLGGKSQFGDWECTSKVDAMARSIPAQVNALEPGAFIHILENELALPIRYRFFPHFISKHHDRDTRTFEFGAIRRRRPVADIHLPGRLPIEIVKESLAVVVRDEVMGPDRAVLTSLLRPDVPYAAAVSLADEVLGSRFERAIKEPAGRSRDIVPIAAHYVMLSKLPPEQMIERERLHTEKNNRINL